MAALDDRARPGQGAYDHPGGQGMAGVAGLPESEASGLSARSVDNAAPGPPCAGAWTSAGARVPRQTGPGYGVQNPQPAGGEAAQGALLPGTPRPRVQREDGEGSVRLPQGQDS